MSDLDKLLAVDAPFNQEQVDFDPTAIDELQLDVADFRTTEGVEYPALLLSGVLFMDSLNVLKSIKKASYRTVDTWIELADDEGFQKIGEIQLDSDMLLMLRHLQIRATLYYDADTVEALDLNNFSVLEKFI